MAWRLGFGLLVLAVLGFAMWSVLLVVRVRELQSEVERNVGCLQQATALHGRTSAVIETARYALPAEWIAAADAMARIEVEGFAGASEQALRETLEAIETTRGLPNTATLGALGSAMTATWV